MLKYIEKWVFAGPMRPITIEDLLTLGPVYHMDLIVSAP